MVGGDSEFWASWGIGDVFRLGVSITSKERKGS